MSNNDLIEELKEILKKHEYTHIHDPYRLWNDLIKFVKEKNNDKI